MTDELPDANAEGSSGWIEPYESLRARAMRLVDLILHYRDATDPAISGGESNKDRACFRALQLMHELTEVLVPWAIDHQVGLAVEGLSFVPRGPQQMHSDATYGRALFRVNDHKHELTGRRLRAERTLSESSDMQLHRQILSNLLRANPGAIPEPTALLAERALTALRFGDTEPLFEATAGYRKVRYAELRLQLAAICFVEYRVARGMKKRAALERVSAAFAVSPETVKGWGKRLKEDFGPVELARERAMAFNAGLFEEEAAARPVVRETGVEPAASQGESYDEEALQKAGLEYRTRQHARSGSNHLPE
jgi:hypothetical protein